METIKETIEILQDLVQINNDRIVGYEQAIKTLTNADEDLKTLFAGMIDESRQAKMALAQEIQSLGQDVTKGTTNSGKIYRAWVDLKTLFTGHNRQTVLENCHRGEDAAQEAYATALKSEHVPAYLQEMIATQKGNLKVSHDEIKSFLNQEMGTNYGASSN